MLENNNLINNIILDIIIIYSIRELLNKDNYNYFFGIGVAIYLFKKYI